VTERSTYHSAHSPTARELAVRIIELYCRGLGDEQIANGLIAKQISSASRSFPLGLPGKSGIYELREAKVDMCEPYHRFETSHACPGRVEV
jgi:hypothetical protein